MGNSNIEGSKLEKGNKKEWSKSLEEKHFSLKMEPKTVFQKFLFQCN